MTDNAPPSHDAASEEMLIGLMLESYKKMLQSTDGMLPARVISYDRDANRAQVQPMLVMVTTDAQRIERLSIASVPVYQYGAGGFLLSFPVNAGNLGWIKAADRDISLFLQSYQLNEPNTNRLHNFSDSVFYPDVMTGYTIDGEDSANCVLQNLSGTVKISLGVDTIKIKAANIILEGEILLDGAVTATSTIAASGDITTGADVIAGDIALKLHGHKDVTPGIANSGEAVVI